ncbi:MAG: HEAT repeat domain-containing protein [Deltaproteobacteria bacterium]|nr:HEAT repeat domain-containing protein [Nannocystaceae bacterium]
MAQTPAAIECLARSKHPRARLLLGQWAGDPIAAKVLVDDPRATRAWLSDQIELTRTGHAVDFDSWALWDTFDLLGTEADPLLPGVRALAMRRPKLDPRFHRYDYDAIRRLGTRKDRGAIPMLLEILVDHRDWRAQELAAQSLGEIGVDANASAQALDDVARAHWSTYVRDMSTWAAARVRGEARTSPPERAWDHWPHDERCPMGYKGQGSGDLFAANMRRQRWPWRTTVGEQTITLTDPQHTRPVLPTELREIDLSAHFPDVAGAGARLGEEATAIWSLRRGSVIGTNFGEFGGSLWWISRRGRVRHLAEANVKDIVQVGDALYAVEGLAHLGLDEGSLIRIEATPQGVRAQPVLKLPGNPVAWWVRGDELWVGTEGGLFAIDPDLHIRALPCDADETYPGTIDDEDSRKIKAALARVRPIIDRCLEALPPVLPCGGAFEHGVGIEFRIDASGSVTAAEPSDSFAMRFPEVEACIAARAVGWRFDPPKGGPALLGYIFTQKL